MLEYLHVGKADNGEVSVFDSRDKFAADYVNGRWILDHMFSLYDLEERFNLVQDEQEAVRLLSEARAALGRPFEQK